MPSDSPKSVVYIGSSMNPTLRAPDRLRLVPCQGKRIRPGDVIVFRPHGSDNMVVHRVISVNAQGIRTRGDGNSGSDRWFLSPDRIVGRVVWAQWGSGWRPIYGGFRGGLYSLAVTAIRMIDSKISSLLHPIYRRLARTGVLRRWLPARMQTRVLSFDRSTGTEFQLLVGRRVIGRLLPGRNQWVIRRPFRLFINEASLPRNSARVRS